VSDLALFDDPTEMRIRLDVALEYIATLEAVQRQESS
jgi:hypothetical protein